MEGDSAAILLACCSAALSLAVLDSTASSVLGSMLPLSLQAVSSMLPLSPQALVPLPASLSSRLAA